MSNKRSEIPSLRRDAGDPAEGFPYPCVFFGQLVFHEATWNYLRIHFLSVFALCLPAILTLAEPGRTDSVRRELENLDPPFRESVLRGWRSGLKGLYTLDRTPTLGNPVTDKVIRKQILEGGLSMPPYSYLTEEEVGAVMEYMKGL